MSGSLPVSFNEDGKLIRTPPAEGIILQYNIKMQQQWNIVPPLMIFLNMLFSSYGGKAIVSASRSFPVENRAERIR